jgi:hypothetical protein
VSRYAEAMQRLYRGVLEAAAHLSPAVRRAAAGVGPAVDLPAGAEAFVDKIRNRAWAIVDEDVAAMKANGFDEDAIYDLTIAAAVGEGKRRLDAGLAAHAIAMEKRRAS